jgi:hypothetical protein
MKNCRTPRQMRDGQWSYGAVSATEDRHRAYDLLIAVIAVAVLAAIAIGGII